jgi:flavorubredoxin
MSIQVRAMTEKRVQALNESAAKLEKELKAYEKKSHRKIWEEELDELVKVYPKWVDCQKENLAKAKKTKKTKSM